jgi:hypothetical protein
VGGGGGHIFKNEGISKVRALSRWRTVRLSLFLVVVACRIALFGVYAPGPQRSGSAARTDFLELCVEV